MRHVLYCEHIAACYLLACIMCSVHHRHGILCQIKGSGAAGLAFRCMVCGDHCHDQFVLRRYVLRRWLEAWKYGSGQDYKL